jgi:hypothetical protein
VWEKWGAIFNPVPIGQCLLFGPKIWTNQGTQFFIIQTVGAALFFPALFFSV